MLFHSREKKGLWIKISMNVKLKEVKILKGWTKLLLPTSTKDTEL